MRFILFVLTVFILSVGFANAQGWEWLNPLPLGNTLIDLDYVSPGQLVSNGYYGAVITSSDNGVSWAIREQSNRIWPEKVEFVGGAVGWGLCDEYGGDGGTAASTIYRTTDLGATWQARYHNDGINIDDCAFLSADYGFAVGYVDSSYMMVVTKTTDGGATWQWAYSPYWMYFDLVFLDSQNGWGLSFHEAYKTSDAGQTWTPVNLPTGETEMSQSMAVLDPNTVWVCTSTDDAHHRYDHLLYTTNGGQTWTRDSLDTTSDLQKIVFADALHGWTCGENGTLYETANGGVTWAVQYDDPAASTSPAPPSTPRTPCRNLSSSSSPASPERGV